MAYENVIIVIVAAGILLFVGSKKLPELARAVGRAQGDYEKGKREAAEEIKRAQNQGSSVGREKLEELAVSLGIDYSNKNDDELRAAIESEISKGKAKV
ncbi:MAG: twin-arginine translocase TatA/TatE family subunit [Nitrososphaera sp.]